MPPTAHTRPIDNDWVLLELQKVVTSSTREEHFVFLRQVGGDAVFPIAIGLYEAAALENALESRVSARPLTHELVIDAIGALGGRLQYALIEALLGGVFYARLGVVTAAGQLAALDCRPSDALCVARAAGIPVFATPQVLAHVSSAAP